FNARRRRAGVGGFGTTIGRSHRGLPRSNLRGAPAYERSLSSGRPGRRPLRPGGARPLSPAQPRRRLAYTGVARASPQISPSRDAGGIAGAAGGTDPALLSNGERASAPHRRGRAGCRLARPPHHLLPRVLLGRAARPAERRLERAASVRGGREPCRAAVPRRSELGRRAEQREIAEREAPPPER